MAKKLSRIQYLRRISLGIFLAAVTVLSILHQKLQNMPSIDSLDPFGALQGAFGWLGKKIFKRRFVVPAKLDRILRWVKYPLLASIIYFTWTTGTLIIRPYDPLAAYGHLSAGLTAVWAEFAIGFILLILTLALSMLYERAFCKYVCPMGAVNAILGRIPLFRIKRESKTCISCSRCDTVCPMNIDVSGAETISSPECIGCLECVTVCPTKKATLVTTLAVSPAQASEPAAAFSVNAAPAIPAPSSTLIVPADIAVDKPLRDMKDQYGYTMPVLKEKFAQ